MMAAPLAVEMDGPAVQRLWHAEQDHVRACDPRMIVDAATLCGHSLNSAAACPGCVASPATVAH